MFGHYAIYIMYSIFGLHVRQAGYTITDLRETYVYVYMIKAIQENNCTITINSGLAVERDD